MALALPGSAHEPEGGETYNRAVLLDTAGREAASHRKVRIFGDASGAGPLAAEDVAEGNRVELLVTPVGSFAIAICKDFFDAHPRIQGLWESIGMTRRHRIPHARPRGRNPYALDPARLSDGQAQDPRASPEAPASQEQRDTAGPAPMTSSR